MAAEGPPVDPAKAGLAVALHDGPDVVLGVESAPPEDLVGVIEHAEQAVVGRRQLDLLAGCCHLFFAHRHQANVADPGQPPKPRMRHRRGRLFQVDLLPGQVGRLPGHLHGPALAPPRGAQIFRIGLLRQSAPQLGPDGRVHGVMVQADVNAIPAAHLWVDDQGGDAIGREEVGARHDPLSLFGGLLARLARHQDHAVAGAPVLGIAAQPPLAGRRPLGTDLGRRQAGSARTISLRSASAQALPVISKHQTNDNERMDMALSSTGGWGGTFVFLLL